MFLINTSNALSKSLRPSPAPRPSAVNTLVWYGHQVTIERRKCVVLMEASSRYGVLMPGLRQKEFQNFPQLFRERLAEELALLHGNPPGLVHRMTEAVDRFGQPVCIQPGSDRSVQAHINDFILCVRFWTERFNQLPADAWEAFDAGLVPNAGIRAGKNLPEGLVPSHAFSSQWMELAGLDPAQWPSPVDPFKRVMAEGLPAADRGCYEIHVELLGSGPAIWRRLRVPANIGLPALHDVLQIAMGWLNCHLHQFHDGQRRYGQPDPEWDIEPIEDESRFRLDQLIKNPGDKLLYAYDFGDGWEHGIRLEKILPPNSTDHRLKCLDGGRACPPEDVGGLPGYLEFLAAISDPTHPDHVEFLIWTDQPFDPDKIDIDEINAELAESFSS